MINLKLYGLPRTYTNWIAYNLMKTWPDHVKVWQNNCPTDPLGENHWKHGEIHEVGGIDGYILIVKEIGAWKRSMKKYMEQGMLFVDERFFDFIYLGWHKQAWDFWNKHIIEGGEAVFWMDPSLPQKPQGEMKALMEELELGYSFPDVDYHIETKRMWRAGDAVPLEGYLTEEEYKYEQHPST